MRRSSTRTDDDCVVFSGPTVQLALAAARSACGPHVQVLRAVRVQVGLRGLLGQARFDVSVRRPVTTTVTVLPVQPPGEDPVLGALDELLEAADERERLAAGEQVDDTAWSWAQQQEVDRLLTELTARSGAQGRREQHPAPDVATHEVPPPGATAADGGAPEDALAEEAVVVPDQGLGSGWDRAELRRLGVPAAVLSRLPVEDPADDAGWRRALRAAIAAVVPAPARPDEQHPVVVSGHGLLGAVAVLRAGAEDGATPGTISYDGKRRTATPATLVEVLASCARS